MKLQYAQIFTQIVSFLIMYFVLKRFAWGPLLKIMNEEKERIQSDFDRIEKRDEESKKTLKEYLEKLDNAEKESKAIIHEAKSTARLIYKQAEEKLILKLRI